MNRCQGITASKKKCTNKTKDTHCHYHQCQKSIYQMPLPKLPLSLYDQNDPIHKIGNDPCSICLCDVEKDEDCLLKCLHKHHIHCIKQMIEPFCPVCRGPLEFFNKINIDNTN